MSMALDDAACLLRCAHLAKRAQRQGEVPVGALITYQNQIIAEAGNACIQRMDPTAHAEIIAIRRAGVMLGNYRMPGTTLYVSLEPCALCASAIIEARVARVVFCVLDPSSGALFSHPLTGHAKKRDRLLMSYFPHDDAESSLRQYFITKR